DDSPNENDPIYTMEDIVVNTADIGFPRLLKVKIHIIFRETNMRNNFGKSEVRQAQVKELLIMTFSSKTAEELKKNEIMKELKDYLRDEMNLIFGPGEVKKVYISEYFVQ
ncbi:MAG: flagellar basal body-associated protein FliL, partial [Candidatus Poribacteria bacterium]